MQISVMDKILQKSGLMNVNGELYAFDRYDERFSVRLLKVVYLKNEGKYIIHKTKVFSIMNKSNVISNVHLS